MNGRILVRSKIKVGTNGDPYWNEKHEVWIDKRINLSTSILTFWIDRHVVMEKGANSGTDSSASQLQKRARLPLGVVTLQRELIQSLMNVEFAHDKSRPLRHYTSKGPLGEKVGGSVLAGFSLNDEDALRPYGANGHQKSNGGGFSSTPSSPSSDPRDNMDRDELDNTITTEIRKEEKRKKIFGSAGGGVLEGVGAVRENTVRTGTIGVEELRRLNRLKGMKQDDQLGILLLMKNLILENDEDQQEMKLPPIAINISNLLPSAAVQHPTLRHIKAAGSTARTKKTAAANNYQKSLFSKIFDQAVARRGMKGCAPPKLIMRSFQGNNEE